MMYKTDLMACDPHKNDRIILTDLKDRKIGTATKEEAHRNGLLHRAFSVLLYREKEGTRDYLLSRRAAGKYHCAGLWANSCCSHPRDGETLPDAAYARVKEELGCTAENLKEIGRFVYRAVFSDGITEYECDHVLIGKYADHLKPDPSEVSETRWVTEQDLNEWITHEPENFAPWAFTVLSMAIDAEKQGRTEMV